MMDAFIGGLDPKDWPKLRNVTGCTITLHDDGTVTIEGHMAEVERLKRLCRELIGPDALKGDE